MSVEIRRVAYAFNSALAEQGENAYFFDCYCSKDGATVIDVHGSYPTREALYEVMEEVIPLIPDGVPAEREKEFV
jgi:hypothetical protein